MPSSKITNQYARRARIIPVTGKTRRKVPENTSNDITSEEAFSTEVYSLINESNLLNLNNSQKTKEKIENTNVDIKRSSLSSPSSSDPGRFLKLLICSLVAVILMGACSHFMSEGSSLSSHKNYQLIRRPSILVNDYSLQHSHSIDVGSPALFQQNEVNGEEISVPSSLDNLADVTEAIGSNDVPTFWHIPRAGGSTVKDITVNCLSLVQASQVGAVISHDNKELKVVEDIEGGKFMNVDTTTPHGIELAISLGLASSPDLDVIVTPYVYLTAKLFDPNHRGRMFTIMRHPIERAVSMYYAVRDNKNTNSMLEDVTLEAYAKGSMVENNWITRFLANQPNGELMPKHEAIAKEILRTKFLVGLLKYKDASIARFEEYFGWSVKGNEKNLECHERLLDWNWSNKNQHPLVDYGSSTWKLLEKQNQFDIRLYEYAEVLFHEQGRLLFQNSGRISSSIEGSA